MEQLLTADGIPLKVSLKKAYRREKLSAFFVSSAFTPVHRCYVSYSDCRHVDALCG